jgi:hypothetical protein
MLLTRGSSISALERWAPALRLRPAWAGAMPVAKLSVNGWLADDRFDRTDQVVALHLDPLCPLSIQRSGREHCLGWSAAYDSCNFFQRLVRSARQSDEEKDH